jgi:hypothetical protein
MSEFVENARAVLKTAKEDIGEVTSLPHRLTLGVTAAAVAFHETTGMEWLLANTGGRAYENLGHNPFIAGGAMATASFAVETALSAGMAFNLSHFRRTAKQVEEIKNLKEAEQTTPPRESRFGRVRDGADKAIVAVGLGTPGVLIQEFGSEPGKSRSERFKTGIKTAGALAITNFALGTAVTGGLSGAEAAGVGQASEVVLPVVESPYLWVGLFATMRATKAITNFRERRRNAK